MAVVAGGAVALAASNLKSLHAAFLDNDDDKGEEEPTEPR